MGAENEKTLAAAKHIVGDRDNHGQSKNESWNLYRPKTPKKARATITARGQVGLVIRTGNAR